MVHKLEDVPGRLSEDFAELVAKQARPGKTTEPFELIVVGSGYGGAMAAARFSRHFDKVVVLERGLEYLPGQFPSYTADLPAHVRVDSTVGGKLQGNPEGLFDLKLGAHVSALVANGLGGGSLINAGVMLEPHPTVFDDECWPEEVRNDESLRDDFKDAGRLLGAATKPALADLGKHRALTSLSGNARLVPITVALEQRTTAGGVTLSPCKKCGDCATGCNYNAKESLDTNLLAIAVRNGARLYTGATVSTVLPAGSADAGWQVTVRYTQPQLQARHGEEIRLSAKRVILASGSFGSTEILMRSRRAGLPVSTRLGRRFSTNGDTMAVHFNQRCTVNAIASEYDAPDARWVGPTITGMLDLRGSEGIVIQDMAVPGPLRRLFGELYTTLDCVHRLVEGDWARHAEGRPVPDIAVAGEPVLANTALYAMMGDDGSDGALEWQEGSSGAAVYWPQIGEKEVFRRQEAALQQRIRQTDAGGRLLPNPVWKALPDALNETLGIGSGAAFTVHPLGGCAMGRDREHGVVNHCGQVFDGSAEASDTVFSTLLVLDGAIVPRALGINPGLSIAALALRATRVLEAKSAWGRASKTEKGQVPSRTIVRDRVDRRKPVTTQIQLAERLQAEFASTSASALAGYRMIVTLEAQPVAVDQLLAAGNDGHAQSIVLRSGELSKRDRGAPKGSWLHLISDANWRQLVAADPPISDYEDLLDAGSSLILRLGGSIELFSRVPSTGSSRCLRSAWSWLWNRGLRDGWQWAAAKLSLGSARPAAARSGSPSAGSGLNGLRRLVRLLRVFASGFSRAGERRALKYSLEILTADTNHDRTPGKKVDALYNFFRTGMWIHGQKTIAYTRCGNPWRQLQELQLTSCPGVDARDKPIRLDLDLNYLARSGTPLLRIVAQEDQVKALADLASLGLYVFRLMLPIHFFSLRAPDPPPARTPSRLPGPIPGHAGPFAASCEVDRLSDGTPVTIRLTRYRHSNATLPPILAIHGYSASGTTFAHPALRPSFAEYMASDRQRDVWIVDLRSSSGLPTANLPWTFEDMAFTDIPVAVDYIRRATGFDKVDVVAHCMGAAMFSMAVLGMPDPVFGTRASVVPGIEEIRKAFRKSIRSATLSQVGPRLHLSEANTLRALFAIFLNNFIDLDGYQFNPTPEPGALGTLLDRFLATVPYGGEDLAVESPLAFWRPTRFARTRHRMDALYGQTFAAAGIDPQVLDHIDDFFGPLSMRTASQVTHFAQRGRLADPAGWNRYVTPEQMAAHWHFPTFYFHCEENGLVDPSSQHVMTKWFVDDDRAARKRTERYCTFESKELRIRGHQNAFIGRNAAPKFFAQIARNLETIVTE